MLTPIIPTRAPTRSRETRTSPAGRGWPGFSRHSRGELGSVSRVHAVDEGLVLLVRSAQVVEELHVWGDYPRVTRRDFPAVRWVWSTPVGFCSDPWGGPSTTPRDFVACELGVLLTPAESGRRESNPRSQLGKSVGCNGLTREFVVFSLLTSWSLPGTKEQVGSTTWRCSRHVPGTLHPSSSQPPIGRNEQKGGRNIKHH